MKRRILHIAACLLFVFWASAEKVPVEKALDAAANYYEQLKNVSLRSGDRQNLLTLAYAERPGMQLRSTGGVEAYYYIFNLKDDGGFIVVAGDDRACPVLGYSFKGNFDYDSAPPVFLLWLQGYREEISDVLKNGGALPPDPEWETPANNLRSGGISLRKAVGPLGTAEWNQGEPYNRHCPMLGSTRTVTGCTATAMAIVMKYHADNGFAAAGTGRHSYEWKEGARTLSVDLGAYEWGNMPKTTGAYVSDTQKEVVARLMYHCGVCIESSYKTSGGGGTGAYPGNVATALVGHFGYDPGMAFIYKSRYTDSDWKSLLKAELDSNRPVFYSGWGSGGHSFVCEGYTDDDRYYMNWGWGGSANGAFRLSALNVSGHTFNSEQAMIFGIKEAGAGADDYSPLRLTADDGKGMSKSVESIERNQPFTVTVKTINNNSFTLFKGSIGVALFDGAGNLKETLGTTTANLSPGYYFPPLSFNCTITQSIAANDILRTVSSTDDGNTWKIINGAPGITDFLPAFTVVAATGVSLDSATLSLTAGQTFQLTATVAPADATNKTVAWSSSNASVASVNASGLITANSAGTATITVTTEDGNKTATCAVTVTPATVPVSGVSLNATSQSLTVGQTFQLTATVAPANATNKTVAWSSSNASVASVNASGLITANSAGTATITTTTEDGNKTATCAVTVTPATVPVSGVLLNANNLSLTTTDGYQLTATVRPFNATNKSISWSSSNASVASVNASGLVTAKFAGTATITVTTEDGGKTATCAVTVTNIRLNHWSWGLRVGESIQLTATVLPEDADQTVTWMSDDPEIATVTSTGLVTAKKENKSSVTISAITTNGLRNSCYIFTYPADATELNFRSCFGSVHFMKVGETDIVAAPENATFFDDILFEIENPNIASLTDRGLLTAVSAGSTRYLIQVLNCCSCWSYVEVEGSAARSVETESELVTKPEEVDASVSQAYIHGRQLHINSPSEEQITVYSLSGMLLYSVRKDAGEANFDITRLPKGVLIVRGSSGWASKVIKTS